MESKEMVTYKWGEGIYSLKDMLILVKYKLISPKQFFDITRYNYDIIKQKEEGGLL